MTTVTRTYDMSSEDVAPLRAGIFIRVSENRADDRAKPERQLKRCTSLCEARGYAVAGVYVDDNVSAFSGQEMPDRDRCWSDLKAGLLDVVVTLHMDRWVRRTRDLLDFVEIARETGALLDTVESGTLDLSTSAGKLVATILAAVSEAESERKGERHALKAEQLALSGKSTGGITPFGWNDDGTLHEINGPALKAAILDYTDGVPLYQIAKRWNDEGIMPSRGKRWTPQTVKQVLVRPRNCAQVMFKSQILQGVAAQWTAVCTLGEWETVCAIAGGSTGTFPTRKHLLGSIPLCTECNAPMGSATTSNKKNGKRYTYLILRCDICTRAVRMENITKYVKDAVRFLLLFEGAESLAPSKKAVEAAVSLREERGHMKTRISELEDLWASGDFSAAKFRKQRTALTSRLEQINEALREIETENAFAKLLTDRVIPGQKVAFQRGVDIERRFEELELEQQRSIIKGLFRIEVLPVGRGNRMPIEERVKLIRPDGSEFRFDEDAA